MITAPPKPTREEQSSKADITVNGMPLHLDTVTPAGVSRYNPKNWVRCSNCNHVKVLHVKGIGSCGISMGRPDVILGVRHGSG